MSRHEREGPPGSLTWRYDVARDLVRSSGPYTTRSRCPEHAAIKISLRLFARMGLLLLCDCGRAAQDMGLCNPTRLNSLHPKNVLPRSHTNHNVPFSLLPLHPATRRP